MSVGRKMLLSMQKYVAAVSFSCRFYVNIVCVTKPYMSNLIVLLLGVSKKQEARIKQQLRNF